MRPAAQTNHRVPLNEAHLPDVPHFVQPRHLVAEGLISAIQRACSEMKFLLLRSTERGTEAGAAIGRKAEGLVRAVQRPCSEAKELVEGDEAASEEKQLKGMRVCVG